MIGLLFIVTAAISAEIGTAIGKSKVLSKEEGIFTMGFLNLFWAAIFLFLISFFIGGGFRFSLDSLPTFSIRALVEMAQVYVGLYAITIADRSTFSFLRILTLPLLLIVDIMLGYTLSNYAFFGVGVITLGFFLFFLSKRFHKKGMWLVLFTAVNAVIGISLYKYDITHFNSVAAEQGLMFAILLIFLYTIARLRGNRPFKLLRHMPFFIQSVSMGFAVVLESFAFLFAPASVIATGKRASATLISIASGNKYFGEKNILAKIALSVLLVVGLFLLVQ